MTSKQNEISIWFFIGISLLVNGVLITGAGIYEFIKPPENPVVLYHYHASLWWGAVLLIAGLIYCIKFAPGRAARTKSPAAKCEEVHVR